MAQGWENPKSAENGKLGGRPKATATIEAQLFRAALAERIGKNAQAWMDAIEKMALGDEKNRPDPNAWEKGMNRAFGKPQEHIDLTSDGEKISGELSPAQAAIISEFEKKMKDSITNE